ncbi:MAG TPA: amidohydrolase family protein, partial [Solirubrobacteraceae bacterium]|nr:amidohydrolase family protein [Solirubrobacteraceae bacterium]
DPAHMLTPHAEILDRLLDAAAGALRIMTIAPELAGALPAIARLREDNVVAALGHSAADYAEAVAAIATGASHATHLFNAMPPLHHREPGLVGAALEADISCELINDGRHVHPAVLAIVARTLSRPVLVTDAIAAAGAGDGAFTLGGQPVRVTDGEARLIATGSLAGSTLTMGEALRRAVNDSGLTVEQASAAASANPAHVLGLERTRGSIAPGRRADMVVLDDDLDVTAVMAGGVWCD